MKKVSFEQFFKDYNRLHNSKYIGISLKYDFIKYDMKKLYGSYDFEVNWKNELITIYPENKAYCQLSLF